MPGEIGVFFFFLPHLAIVLLYTVKIRFTARRKALSI